MTKKYADDPADFSRQARQGNACGEQYTPFGVLAALAQVGEPGVGNPSDPCCGSGLIVGAEMLNCANMAAA